MLSFSSGTGFFANREGDVLTNNHVVEHCRDIVISGAVPLAKATLAAQDAEDDLALLKTDALPTDQANFASGKEPLKAGDMVVIVGYPGQAWQTGQTATRESHIIATTGPHGEAKWLQFADALEMGNSGGPLLDASGNVAGVVAAKGRMYEHNDSGARDELVGKFDIAISLPVVRAFLDAHGVRSRDADSGIYLSSDHITDNARRFVVNVRCRVER